MFTATETETAFGYKKEKKVTLKVLRSRVKFMKKEIKDGNFGEQGDRSLRWAKHHLAGLQLKLNKAIDAAEPKAKTKAEPKAKTKAKTKAEPKAELKAKVKDMSKDMSKDELKSLIDQLLNIK